jgi:hypothetical protein
MRSSQVVRASGCQCRSRNSPGVRSQHPNVSLYFNKNFIFRRNFTNKVRVVGSKTNHYGSTSLAVPTSVQVYDREEWIGLVPAPGSTGQNQDKTGSRGAWTGGIQYARTDPRKYSLAVQTVEKWNNLPEEVKAP